MNVIGGIPMFNQVDKKIVTLLAVDLFRSYDSYFSVTPNLENFSY